MANGKKKDPTNDGQPTPPALPDPDAVAQAVAALVSNTVPANTIQLPEDYKQPPRDAITTIRRGPTGATPIISRYTERGLVDQNGLLERDKDGNPRTQYLDSEIKLEWFSLPFAVRQNYVNRFKEIGLITKRQKLDPNLIGDVELSAFSAILANANIEGRTWRAVLPIMASRAKALGLGDDGTPRFKPTNIRDIERVTQEEARATLGRELQTSELQPFAARVQRQEVRQRQQQTQEPAATSTLIEQGVEKQFGAEADAYKAAQFIQKILGGS